MNNGELVGELVPQGILGGTFVTMADKSGNLVCCRAQ